MIEQDTMFKLKLAQDRQNELSAKWSKAFPNISFLRIKNIPIRTDDGSSHFYDCETQSVYSYGRLNYTNEYSWFVRPALNQFSKYIPINK